ncbi:ribosome biogenesis regulatory protein-domain-containing protein [Syncephalastrum racemosum]|uniref:Ribosome biogenesis regulatory protein n=1 Tax=Syncephalastrum racemosum TaxID=13706 RepID=A0A1X2H7J3_SYNRA|nr:ribosome biogenesis regulatory protein-domain-containing protein [Syncephalastrum racemosum]
MDVTEILENSKSQYKPITVEKLIPVEYDLKRLAAFDTNPFDEKQLNDDRETYLHNLTRDNTQLLVNAIFELPFETAEDVVLAKLPALGETRLPREKPLPKEKPLTRWEKFAKVKGIQNRKRERFVWDEDKKKYVVRWGYAGGEKDKDDWLLEVPQNANPMEDQYAKVRDEKKERIDKNKRRRQRNEEEALAASMSGKKDVRDFKKTELQAAIAASKQATASFGKFDKELKPADVTKKNKNKKQKK